MRIDDLGTLFLKELEDIYDAEQQISKALPAMMEAASSDELRGAFEDHLQATKLHVERIEAIFASYDKRPVAKRCKGMAGLLEEAKEAVEEDMAPHVKDAALVAAAQRVEHYEMAVYGSLRTFARVLGDNESACLLQESLEEEGQADRDLTMIAEETINLQAHAGGSES